MNADRRPPWLRRALLLGVLYASVGLVFAALGNRPAFNHSIVISRLAAWVVSAVVFAAHIAYEQLRLGYSPRSTALHAAVAVGVGAFGLAVAAIVHSLLATVGNRPLLIVALVAWPILTALPAFLVALAASAVLVRLPWKRVAR